MSSTPPPLASPPPPPPATTSSRKRGCLIAVIVTVVLVLGACGGACVMVSRNPGRFAAWWMERGRADFVASVSSDVPEALRAEFAAEFDAHVAFLRGLDAATIQAKGPDAKDLFLPTQFIAEAARDKSLAVDEVERFIELSRAARGAEAP